MSSSESRNAAGMVAESAAPDPRADERSGDNRGVVERTLDEMLTSGTRAPSRWMTLARRMLSFDTLDNVLATVGTGERSERLAALARAFDITYVFNGLENLDNIGDRPVIVFGNHPIGSGNVIGICLLLARRFTDHRIIGHRFMKFIPSLADKMIPVDPFRSASSMNLEALVKLRREFGTQYQALGLFPAGNSSQLKMSGIISDRRWSDAFMRIARHHDALLVPVWFSGRNRLRYYVASKVRAELGFLALPAEFLRLRGKSITVNVGKPISPDLLGSISERDARLSFLRASVYELAPKRAAAAAATHGNRKSTATKVVVPDRRAVDHIPLDEHLELRFFTGAEARKLQDFGDIAEDDLCDATVHVALTPRERFSPFARWQLLDWGQLTPRDLEGLSPILRTFRLPDRLPSDGAPASRTCMEIVAFRPGDHFQNRVSLRQMRNALRQSATRSDRTTDLVGLVSPLETSVTLAGLQFAMLQKSRGDAALLCGSAKRNLIAAPEHHDWRPHPEMIRSDDPHIRRQVRSMDPVLRACRAIGVRFGAAGLSIDAAPRPCILGRLTVRPRS